MRSNCLQLNPDKTKVMWCTSCRRLSQPSSCSVLVAGVGVHAPSPPLAACTTTTSRLQSCGHGVSSTERSVSAIPGSASSCCKSAWSSSSALILITGSDISSSYRRPAFVSSCCIHPLEQLASWHSVILLLGRFLPQSTCSTNHFQLVAMTIRFRVFCSDICYFSDDTTSDLIRFDSINSIVLH